jgi:hypothetical protein
LATAPRSLVAIDVHQGRVALQDTGADAEKRHPTRERIGDGLEDEDRQRTVVGDRPALGGVVLRIVAHDLATLVRSRNEIDGEVEQRLDPDQVGRRRAQNREDLPRSDGPLQTLGELLAAEVARLEKGLHQGVIGLGDHLGQARPSRRRLVGEIGGDLLDLDLGGFRTGLLEGLHGHEVDDSTEAALGTDRELNRDRGASETVLDARQDTGERRRLAIELVDHEEDRQIVLACRLEHPFGDHLDAGHALDDDERTVGDGEGRVGVSDERRVPGRVQQVDLRLLPLEVREGSLERDPPFDFLVLEVGDGVPFLDLPQTVDGARREQQGGGERGLSGVPVTQKCDIADVARFVSLHGQAPYPNGWRANAASAAKRGPTRSTILDWMREKPGLYHSAGKPLHGFLDPPRGRT